MDLIKHTLKYLLIHTLLSKLISKISSPASPSKPLPYPGMGLSHICSATSSSSEPRAPHFFCRPLTLPNSTGLIIEIMLARNRPFLLPSKTAPKRPNYDLLHRSANPHFFTKTPLQMRSTPPTPSVTRRLGRYTKSTLC